MLPRDRRGVLWFWPKYPKPWCPPGGLPRLRRDRFPSRMACSGHGRPGHPWPGRPRSASMPRDPLRAPSEPATLKGHGSFWLAASRHRAEALLPSAAMSRSDEPSRLPLHQRRSAGVMRDRLAGGKSQRASRLGQGRPSQGHLMRSGRPNLVTAAVIPRSSTTCCPPSMARPWCPNNPRPGNPCPGAPSAAKCHWHFGRCSPPSTPGAGVGARSFAYFSIAQ